MPSNDELACVYGALILQDDEIAVTVSSVRVPAVAMLAMAATCS